MDKETEIMRFAKWFLYALSERCIKYCGKAVSSVQFPVFKKFLFARIKRELQYYRLCLDMAAVINEAGSGICAMDVEEVIEGSIDLDCRLKGDIRFLPIRIDFKYEKILPLRKERTERLIHLFVRLLGSVEAEDYDDMVRKAFKKEEFLELNNEILELYTEEAFVVNQSITSLVNVDSEAIAQRMYCSMLDVGIGLNRELTECIFEKKTRLIK
ncbi:MAG: hypothetical protein VST71_10695 [Nitrospirota bacterium]|nr:hypothetical protein [Nitrospirota bacterium]